MNLQPIFVTGCHAYRVVTQGTELTFEYSLFHVNGATERPGKPKAHVWRRSSRTFITHRDVHDAVGVLFRGVGA